MSASQRPNARHLALVIFVLSALNVAAWRSPRASLATAQALVDDFESGADAQPGTAFAMHIVASHGHTFAPATVQRMLHGPDARLTEWAMTHDFSRAAAIEVQQSWMESHPAQRSAAFFLAHQVRRMKRSDLRAYCDARED